jgi:uncharacterized protein YceK
MKKLFVFIFIWLLLAGCTKILNDDLKKKDPKLVVNATIVPDSAFSVNISRSFHVLEDESDKNLPFLDKATVQVFENGDYLFNLDYKTYGNYDKTDYTPETGKKYTLKVSCPGFKDVTCQASIPEKVPILDFDTTFTHISDEEYGDYYYYSGKLKYNDPSGIENQYLLSSKLGYKTETGDTIWGESWLWPDEAAELLALELNGDIFWDDKYTDGKEVTIDFNFYTYSTTYPDNDLPETDTVLIVFYFKTINKDYYRYLNSLEKYFYDTYEGTGPFTEPVVIYTNVDKGYGIFAGYALDTTSVKIVNYEEGGRR